MVIGLEKLLLNEAETIVCPCFDLKTHYKKEFPRESEKWDLIDIHAAKDPKIFWESKGDGEDAEPNTTDDTYDLDNIIIMKGAGSELNGKNLKEFYEAIIDESYPITRENTHILCGLRNAIKKVISLPQVSAPGEANKYSTLDSWNKALCNLAIELWTDPSIEGVSTEGYHLFTYGDGSQSTQVNNIFRAAVLKEMGISSVSGREKECVANVQVHVESADEYRKGMKKAAGYDLWEGFKVKQQCLKDGVYGSVSFDLTDLPNNFYERVEKFNRLLTMDPSITEFEEFEQNQESNINQTEILGCMDQKAQNYNPNATKSDDSCTYEKTNIEKKEESKTPTHSEFDWF